MPVTIEYSDAARANLESIEVFLGINLPAAKAMFLHNYRNGLASVLNTWVREHPYWPPPQMVVKVAYSTAPGNPRVPNNEALVYSTVQAPADGGQHFALMAATLAGSSTQTLQQPTGINRGPALSASPVGPVALFQGYNTFSGAGQATVVGGKSQPTAPQTVNHWFVCTDFSSISTALDIDTSVSDDEFMVASGSVNATFANSLHITSTSVTLLVNCSSLISNEATGFQLRPGVSVPNDVASLAQFISRNGDQFVSSITTGVQLLAAYVFYSTSIDEQTSITTKLSGKDLSDEGEVDINFGANLSSVTQSFSTRQMFSATVLGLEIAPPSEPADIFPFLPNINAANVKPGYVASFATKIYEDAGLLDAIEKYGPTLVTNRTFYGILSGYLDQLEVLQSRFDTIASAYTAYGYHSDTVFKQREKQLGLDLESIQGLIQDLIDDPLKSPPVPGIPKPASLDGTIPVLAFNPIPGPQWGGVNGIGDQVTYFDSSIVLGGNALTAVTINGGNEVNYLILSYGQLPPVHVGAPVGGGKGSQTLPLQGGAYIVSATATAGYEVNSLTLTPSANGTPLTWPPSATPAEQMPLYTVPEGCVIAGFTGSWDTSDTQHTWMLQPVAVQFSPAKWIDLAPASSALSSPRAMTA